ncbi:ABC transporter permease [Nocardioides sp. Root1257]|uniref:ABC transporter permease n=1 Tax=unclassified Nocardioides TaxID=2615069 RepID=UPI0006FF7A3C|nr:MULTISPECIES: ABC transporter permease [unclassified Nocardioides]KQW47857.1 ABC transporter permease [Nocardioides sp. Root1257]KRC45109.1 ABC transporter permease [Nocardioides sp. Root224]
MTAAVLEHEVVRTERPTPARIPMSRLISVELRKSFDTRSGFWLMASIGILAVIATVATIVFAPESELDYEAFASAIGFPMAVVLPIIAALLVTSEWSQRSGLTTFTLVPHRGRVITAKLAVSVGIGAVSMLIAAAIGAVGNVVGTAITGTDTVWNVSAAELSYIIIANVLGMLVGFMLGVLMRNSAAAIVGYFVYSFALPPLTFLLAQNQQWFKDLQPWVDFNYAQGNLFNGVMTGTYWAQLAVTTFVWLVVPLVVGLRLVLRSEVK